MTSLTGLAAALLLAAATPPKSLLTLPAVGVGDQAPGPSVLQKLTELLDDSVRRAGVPPPGLKEDPAQAKVEGARAAYFDLRFKDAAALAEQAVAMYREHPENLGDGARYIDAHLYAALAQLELGKESEAQEHLTAALTVRPNLHLLESDFSPTALAAIERARDQTSNRSRGTVTISTSPAFARLKLDGSAQGETPLTAQGLLVGRHFVTVSKDGHLPVSVWVEVKGSGSDVAVTLPPSPAEKLRVELATRLAAGAGAELEPMARELAKASDAGAVLVLAVGGTAGGRTVVSVARVGTEGQSVRAYTTVADDLFDAAPALERLARAVLADGGAAPLAVGDAPKVKLDFSHRYLGLEPPLPKAVLTPLPPAAPPPTPFYKKPWVWVVAGGVVAGAAVGTYFLVRPAPKPAGVAVTLTLPEPM